MTAHPIAIRVRGLCKSFQHVKVLSGVDVDLAAGETVALTGDNGSGKTTLLRCLAGRLQPNSGSVQWLGPGSRHAARAPKRRIGMVAHQVQLYSGLTVRENLLFAARMNGLPRPRAIVARWLDRLGLAPWAEWPSGQLSRGMRQRVAIARVLLHEPSVLLLDEPFTGLDVAGRQWVDGLMQGFAEAGRAVCFTTHDHTDVCRLADRVLRMTGGAVQDVRSPAATTTLRAAG